MGTRPRSPKESPRSAQPSTAKDDERRLFEAEMRGVRPLRPGPIRVPVLPGSATSAAKRTKRAPTRATLEEVDQTGDSYGYAASGADRAVVRELRRGDLRPEATLDLHGQTAEQAGRALERFVTGALRRHQRVVLVIHGRGLRSGTAGPVLRDEVLARLTSGPLAALVLAVVSAPPSQGGSGAALLWLRRG